jgi:hypothetical protein
MCLWWKRVSVLWWLDVWSVLGECVAGSAQRRLQGVMVGCTE